MDKSGPVARPGLVLALAIALAACSGEEAAPPRPVAGGQEAVGAGAALHRFAPDPANPYEVPEPEHEVRVETDLMVPMRDGVRLATDLYLPAEPAGRGDRLPVVMIRLPYDKASYRAGAISPAQFFAGHGYAVVVQDVRGKYASEGRYLLSAADREDGYDAVEWAATQPWSNGKVGTFGCSYLGENQTQLMAQRHPAHAAAIPLAAGGSVGSAGGRYGYFGIFEGGAFGLSASFGWFRGNGRKRPGGEPPPPVEMFAALRELPTVDLMRKYGPPDRDTDWEEVYYVMGRNEWASADTWPPAGAEMTRLYLRSGGNANTRFGDGVLSAEAPGEEPPDRFVYDPADPVPSRGGSVCCTGNPDDQPGAFDQSDIEEREDVLVYTGDPVGDGGLEIAGPLEARLYVSSSAPDTDFTVKLLDVHPDGRAINIVEGIMRARYRDGYEEPAMMEEGQVYPVRVDLHSVAHRFAPGHRVRIEVSSSNFPRFDRNLNTGGNNYDETEWEIAENVIHHAGDRASHIVLPVMEGGG